LDAYHWHLELIPKLSTAAGFELGTGMWINVVKPEESAAFLRDRIGKTAEQPAGPPADASRASVPGERLRRSS
jgi:galactose-1-phosphate uridylyltransferase